MATLNASKWGHIVSSNYTTHAAARGASSGFTATVNPTTTQTSIAYRRFTARGRGNNFYQIRILKIRVCFAYILFKKLFY